MVIMSKRQRESEAYSTIPLKRAMMYQYQSLLKNL